MSGERARTGPTVLAVLAFVPLAALLWWALAGPRPEPARLDWGELGYRVTEEGPSDEQGARFDGVIDAALATMALEGHQRPLLGTLDESRIHGDGTLVAVVREAGPSQSLTEAPDVAGLVVARTAAGGDPAYERCAFDPPLAVARLDELAEELGQDVHAVPGEATGRCGEGGAELFVPLVRRVVVPMRLLQRLAGQSAESAVVPAGVARVDAGGSIEVLERVGGDGAGGAPVYPREVARQALLRAAPDNPNATIGTLADPAYPVLARSGDDLWWVIPVSPGAGGEAVSGFALTRADRVEAGRLNPVTVRWLAEPLPGPVPIERRALETLEEAGEIEAADRQGWRVWLGVPGPDGAWHGRVARAGQVRFRLEAAADGTVCVDDFDGRRMGCLGPGA